MSTAHLATHRPTATSSSLLIDTGSRTHSSIRSAASHRLGSYRMCGSTGVISGIFAEGAARHAAASATAIGSE